MAAPRRQQSNVAARQVVEAPAPAVERNSFFSEAVELSHSWKETGSEKLTADEIEAIDKIRIGQGQFGKQMVFTMKSGKTRVMNLSSFCEDFELGTVIRPSSVVITELYDEDEGRYIYRASGEAM